MPQEFINQYQIISEYYRSSQAVLYQARDLVNQRVVAVKLFTWDVYTDPTIRARYQREQQLISALDHPAVVPVYEFGEFEQRPYIVMAWMPGGSLLDKLENGTLDFDRSLAIFERIAPALDAVHNLGIIHADLKPGNILFDAQGQAYLSDFGMMKLAEATQQENASSLLGPPVYMSPEQAQRGLAIDSRSDQYMLGVILFEMLTGRLPYEALTNLGYAVQKITQPFHGLADLRPDLPRHVDIAITRSLMKNPQHRFASLLEFVAAIKGEVTEAELAVEALPAPMLPKRRKPPLDAQLIPRRRRRSLVLLGAFLRLSIRALGLIAVLLVAALGLLTAFYIWRPLMVPVIDYDRLFNLAPDAVVTSTQHVALLRTPTDLPTSTPKPTATQRPTRTSTPIAPLETALITQSPGLTEIVVSESLGSKYTVTSLDTLFQISGKFSVRFENFLGANNLACESILPIGTSLIVPGEPAFSYTHYPAPLVIGTTDQIQQRHVLPCMQDIAALRFSPDQRYLAGAAGNAVYIWRVGEWRPVYHLRGHIAPVTALDFSSDSQLLATGSEDTTVRLWSMEDGSQLNVTYRHRSAVVGLAFIPYTQAGLSVSADGDFVRWSNGTFSPEKFLEPVYSLAVSPDGSRLAVGHASAVDLYQFPGFRLLHRFAALEPVRNLTFSPDSNLLASNRQLWQVKQLLPVYSFEEPDAGVVFSRDGQLLLIGGSIYQIANGARFPGFLGQERAVPGLLYNRVALSPDGSLLAWGTDQALTIWGLPPEAAPPLPKTSLIHIVKEEDTLLNIAYQNKVKLAAVLELNGLTCNSPLFASQRIWIPDSPEDRLSLLDHLGPPIRADSVSRLRPLKDLEMQCVLGVSDLLISPDQRFLISGSALWDIKTGAVILQANDIPRRFDGAPEQNLRSPVLSLSPDLTTIAMRLAKQVLLWDAASGRLLRTLEGHTGDVTSIIFSPDGKTLVSGSGVDEQAIRLWDFASGSLGLKITGLAVEKLVYALDGKQFFAIGKDSLRIFRQGEVVSYRSLVGVTSDLVFSPNQGRIAYSVCTNRSGGNCLAQSIRVYEFETEQTQIFTSQVSQIFLSPVFSPDGTALAAAAGDGMIVWNTEDKTVRFSQRIPDSKQPLVWVQYSPDGGLLAGMEKGNRLHFWDMATGDLLYTIPEIQIDRMAWAPDRTFIAILSAGSIQIWGIDPR
jgi:WD40 repeat protein/serine/threonine protein kinase